MPHAGCDILAHSITDDYRRRFLRLWISFILLLLLVEVRFRNNCSTHDKLRITTSPEEILISRSFAYGAQSMKFTSASGNLNATYISGWLSGMLWLWIFSVHTKKMSENDRYLCLENYFPWVSTSYYQSISSLICSCSGRERKTK